MNELIPKWKEYSEYINQEREIAFEIYDKKMAEKITIKFLWFSWKQNKYDLTSIMPYFPERSWIGFMDWLTKNR